VSDYHGQMYRVRMISLVLTPYDSPRGAGMIFHLHTAVVMRHDNTKVTGRMESKNPPDRRS